MSETRKYAAVSFVCLSTPRAGRAHHGAGAGGAGEQVSAEHAAGHRDPGGSGHRIRRGRGL